ncbi:MAG: Gfo/Idh/MocA family oxidoreductase, partial [Acidimicrobiales bacterium]
RVGAEDLVVASLRFASGALGALTVTTASYPGASETIAVAGPEASVLVESGRVVSWRSARGAGDEDGTASPPAGSAARGSRGLAVDAHRAQLQDVVDAVREARRPAVTGEDGRAALAVIAAAYASARSGGDVAVV